MANGQIILKDFTTDLITTKYYWDNFLDDYWRDFYLKIVTKIIAWSRGIVGFYGNICSRVVTLISCDMILLVEIFFAILLKFNPCSTI